MLPSRPDLRRLLAAQTNAPLGSGAFTLGNILLIGEQASHPQTDPDQEPFCSGLGCSGWICDQLDIENFNEQDLFWINARHNDGRFVDLPLVVRLLKPRAILALGKVAESLCVKVGAPHKYIPHPQYWKRFKSKLRYPLLDELHALKCSFAVT